MDKDFLDKLITTHARASELFEGRYIMNNNSFFSLIVDKKPYKLVNASFAPILGYNTLLKLTSEEAKYLHTKHGIKHLLGWTIK